MPSDEDILRKLDSIDPDELMGEEVSVDDALDFNLEDEPVADLTAEAGSTQAEVEPQAQAEEPQAEPAQAEIEPQAESAQAESAQAEVEPQADTKPKKRKARRKMTDSPVAPAATIEAGGRIIFVDEIVLHAKKLRIIAENISIEPMDVTAPDAS